MRLSWPGRDVEHERQGVAICSLDEDRAGQLVMNDGTIDVLSNGTEGTLFTIRFPSRPPLAAGDVVAFS